MFTKQIFFSGELNFREMNNKTGIFPNFLIKLRLILTNLK